MRTYSMLQLHNASNWNPEWQQNSLKVKDTHRYTSPTYEITRNVHEPVYLVKHVPTGETCEIAVANVRSAPVAVEAAMDVERLERFQKVSWDPKPVEPEEPKAEPEDTDNADTVPPRRGPGRPRKS